MNNTNPTSAQLALNLSQTPFVLKEQQNTHTIRELMRLLSDKDFSDQDIRKLGNNQELIPYSGGWLKIFPSNPRKEGNRYRWDIALVPHAISLK